MKHLLGAYRDREKEKLSKETTARMTKYAAEGKYLGGRLPFGYRNQLGKIIIDEGQAAIVKRNMHHVYVY